MTLVGICRVLTGLSFFVFGVDGFLHFLPPPKQTEQMSEFVNHMIAARFILPMVKAIEISCGLMLFANYAAVGALLALLPIVFGIACSQFLFNRKHGYGITFFILIPYLVIIGKNLGNLTEALSQSLY